MNGELEEDGIRVAIVGCGQSGICIAKKMTSYSMKSHFLSHLVIFESSNELGGMWARKDLCYNSLKTNLSRFTCNFSECEWDSSTVFPSQREMQGYLFKYACKPHSIYQSIRFGSKVVLIRKQKMKYLVQSINCKNAVVNELFDVCIIANGFFAQPNDSNLNSIKSFKGRILHSNEYKEPNEFRDKTVAVIGSSHSACEIATEIASYMHSNNSTSGVVIHINNHDLWVLPRFLPINAMLPASPMMPLDFVFYRLSTQHSEKLTSCAQGGAMSIPYFERVFRDEGNLRATKSYLTSLMQPMTGNKDFLQSDEPIYVAICDNYYSMYKSGRIQHVHGRVTDLKDDCVIIDDRNFNSVTSQVNTLHSIDDIIVCSGFKPKLDFFDNEILSVLEYDELNCFMPIILHRDIMHPQFPNLFFIGMYRGPYMGTIEAQSELILKYLTHDLPLPTVDEFISGMNISRRIRDYRPRQQFPHSDYLGHMLDLSISCQQSFDHLKLNMMVTPSHIHSLSDENTLKTTDETQYYFDRFNNGYYISYIILMQLEGKWIMSLDHETLLLPMFGNFIKLNGKDSNSHDDSLIFKHSLSNNSEVKDIILHDNVKYEYNIADDCIDVYQGPDCTPDSDSNVNKLYSLKFKSSDNGWTSTASIMTETSITWFYSYCIKFTGAIVSNIELSVASNRIQQKFAFVRE